MCWESITNRGTTGGLTGTETTRLRSIQFSCAPCPLNHRLASKSVQIGKQRLQMREMGWGRVCVCVCVCVDMRASESKVDLYAWSDL